ncbi:LRR receptor-like serine/threonine-protein kinase FLS2 [Tripterygium wilfordii]|uniref:LRR receptor-like serine/threonine-protein kinase FLS2 n=1 Tax=Tripterygium wilfordii TaxID=458696 RepID=A0A7J7E3C2_TRIWF|nr:receptor-like protein 53 [Tripterygium wilfordii]KAF5753021.1 LRR receptor-like serine/threonine-protein kinase FLS2 [Tripterygium wilfordii]
MVENQQMGTFKLSLFSLLVLISVAGMLCIGESKTEWGDIEALKEFKMAVEPNSVSPGSCLSSWDFGVDPCDNLFGERFMCGFRCDSVVAGTSRVTELALDQAGYAGSLGSISLNLPFLQTLDLSSNYFYGSIPYSLSNLTRLTRLVLSRNSFSGEIPSSIGSLASLEELYLDFNNLQGAIPSSFNGLVSLKMLEIQSNKLSGDFPELGSLKNLNSIDASDNSFSGQIQPKLPTSLIEISMRNNTLEGTIPETFKDLYFLQVLDLSHNKLSGSVPSLLFTHPSLQQLTVSFNSFNSILPPSDPSKSQLIAIDLSDNALQGLLPSFIALLPKLSALTLENNKFTGMIPTQYAWKTVLPRSGFSQLSRLWLGGNYLFGPIPSPLMTLKPDSANVRLTDNCLFRCPATFFFCQGGDQKSMTECKSFVPFIP